LHNCVGYLYEFKTKKIRQANTIADTCLLIHQLTVTPITIVGSIGFEPQPTQVRVPFWCEPSNLSITPHALF
jgi:hypothetical protein